MTLLMWSREQLATFRPIMPNSQCVIYSSASRLALPEPCSQSVDSCARKRTHYSYVQTKHVKWFSIPSIQHCPLTALQSQQMQDNRQGKFMSNQPAACFSAQLAVKCSAWPGTSTLVNKCHSGLQLIGWFPLVPWLKMLPRRCL